MGIVESHIVMGYGCNHQCVHCVVQMRRLRQTSSNPNLSDDEARQAVQTAIDNGATKIVFSGGEPTLRPVLEGLVYRCLEQGIDVQIQTNGSNPMMIKQICEGAKESTKKIEFMLPLHSANSAENDAVCHAKGAYAEAQKSLDYLASTNAKIIGKIVLSRHTGELDAICRLYDARNAASVIVAYPHCVSFPDSLVRDVDLTRNETRRIFSHFYESYHNVPVLLQAFPRCFIDAPNAVIQEEQEDFLSTQVVEYKFRAAEGNDWHKYRRLDKRKFNHCPSCPHNDICEGIWKEYIRVYGDE